MAVIDQYFQHLVESGASDLHLSEGQPPKMRAHGSVSPIAEGALEHDTLKHMLSEICEESAFEHFLERGDLDFAYEMDQESRFRCNYFKQKNGLGAVFRLIPTKIATIADLGLPDVIERFGDIRSGLVLVTPLAVEVQEDAVSGRLRATLKNSMELSMLRRLRTPAVSTRT